MPKFFAGALPIYLLMMWVKKLLSAARISPDIGTIIIHTVVIFYFTLNFLIILYPTFFVIH